MIPRKSGDTRLPSSIWAQKDATNYGPVNWRAGLELNRAMRAFKARWLVVGANGRPRLPCGRPRLPWRGSARWMSASLR